MTTKNVTTNTDKNGLNWTHFPAGEHGFFRAPVLITGEHEAILIDAGFTFSDGNTVAEAIKVSGKKLTTIYLWKSQCVRLERGHRLYSFENIESAHFSAL